MKSAQNKKNPTKDEILLTLKCIKNQKTSGKYKIPNGVLESLTEFQNLLVIIVQGFVAKFNLE
eukprot:snap_masked-scaffold_13-processed-gene-11.32-mRNA-1 protein AED:1.00 eAED:1.00 QI:0/-1/0/0/-1/1/1/0/62